MALLQPTIPRWADTSSNVTEPASGKKDIGWIVNEVPPSSYQNWLQKTTGDWFKWVQEKFVDDTTFTSGEGVLSTKRIRVKSAQVDEDSIIGQTFNTGTYAPTGGYAGVVGTDGAYAGSFPVKTGVFGFGENGVYGEGITNGVQGISLNGYGVKGSSVTSVGVVGEGNLGGFFNGLSTSDAPKGNTGLQVIGGTKSTASGSTTGGTAAEFLGGTRSGGAAWVTGGVGAVVIGGAGIEADGGGGMTVTGGTSTDNTPGNENNGGIGATITGGVGDNFGGNGLVATGGQSINDDGGHGGVFTGGVGSNSGGHGATFVGGVGGTVHGYAAVFTGNANVGAIRLIGTTSAPVNASAGAIYYDTDDNHFYGHTGSGWVQLDN
jgi:hypothetical protein